MTRTLSIASIAVLAFSLGCQPPPATDDVEPGAIDREIREDDGLGIDVTPTEGDVGSAYRPAPAPFEIRDPDAGPAAMVPETEPVGADDYKGPNSLATNLSGAAAAEANTGDGPADAGEPAAGGVEPAGGEGRGATDP